MTEPRVGDRVRMSSAGKSKYPDKSHNPHDEEGEVFSISSRVRVKWDNGETNSYLEGELEQLDRGFKVGDKVIITGNTNRSDRAVGDICYIHSKGIGTDIWCTSETIDGKDTPFCVTRESDMELYEETVAYSVGDIIKRMSAVTMVDAGIPEGTKLLCVGSTETGLYTAGETKTLKGRLLHPGFFSGGYAAWKIISLGEPKKEEGTYDKTQFLTEVAPNGFYLCTGTDSGAYKVGKTYEVKDGGLFLDGARTGYNGYKADWKAVPEPLKTDEEQYVWTYDDGEVSVSKWLPTEEDIDVVSVNKLGASFEKETTTTITWKEVQ